MDPIDLNMRKALIRDGFRCVLTRRYDFRYLDANRQVFDIAMSSAGRIASTHLAHIVCESSSLDIKSHAQQLVGGFH
jgi:hypothetical protein